MFSFFSKSKSKGGSFDYSILGSDMHSHLIPGIDDGSPDMETSLFLVKGLHQLGYRKLITTPHVMWDMYRNTDETIITGRDRLISAVKNAGIDVDINAAAEYFLDEHSERMIAANQPFLKISANMVLVEFSLAHPPFSLKENIFSLLMQGYIPVIAHPERYIYLDSAKELYDELKDSGCYFQLNILSLSGAYGKSVTELANYLVKKKYYNLLGTDLHHERHLHALSNPTLKAAIQKVLDSCEIVNDQL